MTISLIFLLLLFEPNAGPAASLEGRLAGDQSMIRKKQNRAFKKGGGK
jgi:hypothetical protein